MFEKEFLNPTIEFRQDYLIKKMAKATSHRGNNSHLTNKQSCLNILSNHFVNGNITIHKFPVPSFLQEYISSWSFIEDLTQTNKQEYKLGDTSAWLIISLPNNHSTLTNLINSVNGYVIIHHFGKMALPNLLNQNQIFIRFTPAGLFGLTGIPLTHLDNTIIDAAYYFGSSIETLYQQLLSTQNYFELLTNFFVSKANAKHSTIDRQVVNYVISNLDLPLKYIFKKTGYSEKHVIYLIKKQVGLSPKNLQLLHKLRKTLMNYNTFDNDLYSMAANFGFYDDSHFSRVFKKFFEITPGSYQKSNILCPNRILDV